MDESAITTVIERAQTAITDQTREGAGLSQVTEVGTAVSWARRDLNPHVLSDTRT